MLADLRNAKTHSNFGMQANSLFTLQSIIYAELCRSNEEIIFTAGNDLSLAVHVWWEEGRKEKIGDLQMQPMYKKKKP